MRRRSGSGLSQTPVVLSDGHNNRRYLRSGHLFLGPYSSRVVESQEHLLQACVYVVLNPVPASLCARPSEWRWSSYAATAEPLVDGATQADLLLGCLAEDLPAARARYRRIVDEAVRELRSGRRLVPG
jgi:hypothetical protein